MHLGSAGGPDFPSKHPSASRAAKLFLVRSPARQAQVRGFSAGKPKRKVQVTGTRAARASPNAKTKVCFFSRCCLLPREAGPNATSKCRAHGQHEDPTCARASKPKTTCRLRGPPYTHDPPCGPGPNDSARTKSGEKQTWLQPGWKLELKFKCPGFRTAPGRRRPQDPLKRTGPARKLEQDSPKIKSRDQI